MALNGNADAGASGKHMERNVSFITEELLWKKSCMI